MAMLIYIPTNIVQGFTFLHILTYTCYLLVFLIMANWAGVRWFLIVVLICICLMISNLEHYFMDLLAICISSFEKCVLGSAGYFVIGLFWTFLLLSLVPYILRLLTLVRYITCKYFLLFCKLSLHSVIVSFAVQRLLSLMKSYFIFAFVSYAFGFWSLSIPVSWSIFISYM